MLQCKEIVEAPYTDFDQLFLDICNSRVSHLHSPERFIRTPVSQLIWVARETQLRECESVNAHSHTTAELAVLMLSVAQGFAGVKDTKNIPDPKRLLPFANLDKYREGAKRTGPSTETKRILTELVKSLRLPTRIYAALITEPPGRR